MHKNKTGKKCIKVIKSDFFAVIGVYVGFCFLLFCGNSMAPDIASE